MKFNFSLNGKDHAVHLQETAEGLKLLVEGQEVEATATRTNPHSYDVVAGGRNFRVVVDPLGGVEVNGQILDLEMRRAKPELIRAGGAKKRGEGKIKPPMPGKVVEVTVEIGQEVAEGEVLLVLEAMKMQNDLKSPIAGTVSAIHVEDNQNVEATTVMIEIEPLSEE